MSTNIDKGAKISTNNQEYLEFMKRELSYLCGRDHIIVHDFPNWSVYLYSGKEYHSFEFNGFIKRALWKHLESELLNIKDSEGIIRGRIDI